MGTRPRYGPMCLARRLRCAPPLAPASAGPPPWEARPARAGPCRNACHLISQAHPSRFRCPPCCRPHGRRYRAGRPALRQQIRARPATGDEAEPEAAAEPGAGAATEERACAAAGQAKDQPVPRSGPRPHQASPQPRRRALPHPERSPPPYRLVPWPARRPAAAGQHVPPPRHLLHQPGGRALPGGFHRGPNLLAGLPSLCVPRCRAHPSPSCAGGWQSSGPCRLSWPSLPRRVCPRLPAKSHD